MEQKIAVEVVYCQPSEQHCISLQIAEGCTVADAVEYSDLLARFKITLSGNKPNTLGIFGKQITPDTILKNGDRVEIYRPLLLSPTEARRLRAKTRSNTGIS